MYKLLVGCDEYCYQYDNKYYCGSNAVTFANRYLRIFDKVVFFIRTKYVEENTEIKNKIEITDNRIEIFPVPFFQGPKEYAKVYFKVKKRAQEAIKECNRAIFRLPSTVGFAAWEQWRKSKNPYAVEIVYDCYDAYENSTNPLEKFLWKKLHRQQVKACKESDGVACVTREYLQRRYFPLKSDAFLSHYSSIEMTEDFYFHPRKSIEKDTYRLVHVANNVEKDGKKGHEEVIEAVKQVNKAGINLEVVFVGNDYKGGIGKLKEYSRQTGIEEKVKFTGFLNKSSLREELKKADIAVLPTKAEGLPRVVIEAMAMGLPCVTSPVSGNPELIDSEFLVDYHDINGLAQKIINLTSNKSLYENQSKINFNRSKEYSVEILNPRRTEFYKHLRNK